MGCCCTVARSCVSKKKTRTKAYGVDLDLTVIHPGILVMGFPSFGLEAWYRNRYEDVLLYLDTHCPDYLVVNLCSEPQHQYDAKKCFHGRCASEPFPDHTAPALAQIVSLIDTLKQFLAGAAGRMVALHCKAGKGRSGTMACCLLMAVEKDLATAEAAMAHYGRTRTANGKGVTIPSQRRYVQYFERLLRESGGALPAVIPERVLVSLGLVGLHDLLPGLDAIIIAVGAGNGAVRTQVTVPAVAAGSIVSVVESSVDLALLKGDVHIRFLAEGRQRAVLSVHTLFLKEFYPPAEIDGLHKMQHAAGAGLRLVFSEATRSSDSLL